jgi:hypothetical protein
MAEFTKELENLIRESHDDIRQLHDALIGIDGQGGMMRRVQTLENNYAKLNRNFWILVAFLTGTSILGTGIWALVT